jgi:hypothetical protein
LIVAAFPATAALADDDARQELLKLESQIADAVVQRDAAFVERVWADDFVYTGVRGEIKNKQDILAELQSGKLRFEQMRFDDQQVRVYGAAAVVTGRATTSGPWQLVTFQGTPIAVQSGESSNKRN